MLYPGSRPPALLQLASRKEAFLVDLMALRNNEKLDQMLGRVMQGPVVIGFGF